MPDDWCSWLEKIFESLALCIELKSSWLEEFLPSLIRELEGRKPSINQLTRSQVHFSFIKIRKLFDCEEIEITEHQIDLLLLSVFRCKGIKRLALKEIKERFLN